MNGGAGNGDARGIALTLKEIIAEFRDAEVVNDAAAA